jgi:adenylate cyclase
VDTETANVRLPAWIESEAGTRTFVRGTCTFGRTGANDVVVSDEKVSRRHAMIHVQSEGECWLVDLGSANGTYLNDRRVTQPSRLSDGDRVTIARHQFTFRAAGSTHAHSANPSDTIRDVRTENCWLLLADIENSTQFIQRLSSDDIPRVTGRWLATCKQVIDENLGTINKYLGDGFFAYWIDGEGTATAVARAIKSLQELQQQDGPRFRVALHYGPVSIGGGPSLGEECLLGPQVNFLFRIEKLAGKVGVSCLISEAAHEAFHTVLPMSPQGRHPVTGFPNDHLFFTLQ